MANSLKIWNTEIIPNWHDLKLSKRAQLLWWHGYFHSAILTGILISKKTPKKSHFSTKAYHRRFAAKSGNWRSVTNQVSQTTATYYSKTKPKKELKALIKTQLVSSYGIFDMVFQKCKHDFVCEFLKKSVRRRNFTRKRASNL